jgi:DNA-binding Xre family transcriptional regulator
MVLMPCRTISEALAAISAEGGPHLDIPALAEQAEVSVVRLHQLDQGHLDAIDLSDLDRLCQILGRSPNDLLGYEADW